MKTTAYLQTGDICVNSTGTGTLGRVALWEESTAGYFADTHVTIVRPDRQRIEPAFLAAFLGMPSTKETIYRECVTGSTNQIELSKSALSELLCPTPPLDEQRRIADVLRSVDKSLASYDAISTAATNVAQRLSSLHFAEPDLYEGPHPLSSFGDLFDIKGGSQPPKSTFIYEPKPGFVRLLQIRDFERDDKAAYISEASSSVRCREQDILIARYGASVGRILTGKAGAYNVALTKVVFRNDRIHPRYAYHWLKSGYFQDRIATVSGRSAQAGFNKEDLFPTKVILPPHEEQRMIADTLDDLEKQAGLGESARRAVLTLKSSLLSDLLSGRVRVPTHLPTMAGAGGVQPAFKRAVFAAEVVHQLRTDARFGSVKHEKIVHLCELHLGLQGDLDRHAYKEAAGPYDPSARRSVERIFRQQKWFDPTKQDKRVVYVPLEASGGHARYFDRYFGDRRADVQEVIDLLRPLNTRQCEIVATLYAVWNDFLIDGHQPSDDEIVDGVLNNWTESKREIAEEKWRAALPWMRKKRFVPSGRGEKTRVAAK